MELLNNAASVSVVVQTVLLLASILYVNRQFGIVRACSYIERFNSEETARRRAAVDRWLESEVSEVDLISRFEADADLRVVILGFMNLFQELGVAYKRHGVHKATIQGNFDLLVPHYWSRFHFLIVHLRVTRGSPTGYRHFEDLARALSKGT